MGREDEIRVIAYSIWQQEGCLDGQDCEHWLKAEVIWEERQKKGPSSEEGKTKPRQAAGQFRKNRAPGKR
jgi:hypothetical protein